ncbi:MAG TPA: hypothetical protein VMJ75_20470 [Candidatus Acidoferrales bacterium]|nr:hypothetical protein [Candidatus Acidoferrales bacterium]
MPPPVMQASAPMADNVASALAYIFIVNIVFLVIAPYNRNPTVRFHAFQSLFFDLCCIVLWIGMGIVLSIVAGVVGFWAIWPLYWLVRLAVFLAWVYLFVQAYQGKTVVLPVIGPLAQQQARV